MCIRDRQGPPTSLGESPRAEKANNKSDSAGRLLTLSFRDLPQGRDLTRKSHHSQPSPKPTPNTIDLRYCGGHRIFGTGTGADLFLRSSRYGLGPSLPHRCQDRRINHPVTKRADHQGRHSSTVLESVRPSAGPRDPRALVGTYRPSIACVAMQPRISFPFNRTRPRAETKTITICFPTFSYSCYPVLQRNYVRTQTRARPAGGAKPMTQYLLLQPSYTSFHIILPLSVLFSPRPTSWEDPSSISTQNLSGRETSC